MKRYAMIKHLFREARRLSRAYLESDWVKEQELCAAMARNSFVAHSIFAGCEKSIVEQVANRVFPAIR